MLLRSRSGDLSEIAVESPGRSSSNRSSSSSTTTNPRRTLTSSTAANANSAAMSSEEEPKDYTKRRRTPFFQCMSSIRLVVLVILCLQNSLYTVLRRYSQGILKEEYSKYEVLMMAELIKILFSAWMIRAESTNPNDHHWMQHLSHLATKSGKMVFLALIYGAMNILSFVSLRNIGAGVFTIFAQCKILTTATFSALILQRTYSTTKWRALVSLMLGVLLFSEPIWSKAENLTANTEGANEFIGIVAVIIEVTLSGFSSIYFEKVIKVDPHQLTIWERNFQLALGSFPIYILFIIFDSKAVGLGRGWSIITWILAALGAAGGLLVALSIKYGDSILKTIATTGAITISAVIDHLFLGGPLTPIMIIAGIQVVISICDYTFDMTPTPEAPSVAPTNETASLIPSDSRDEDEEAPKN